MKSKQESSPQPILKKNKQAIRPNRKQPINDKIQKSKDSTLCNRPGIITQCPISSQSGTR